MSNQFRAQTRYVLIGLFVIMACLFTTAAFAQNIADQISGQAERVGQWQATTILAAVAILALGGVVLMARHIVQRDREDRAWFEKARTEDRELLFKIVSDATSALKEAAAAAAWCRDHSGGPR